MSPADVWQRYGRFLRRAPEITLEWNDPETPARGWLVINSARGGATGGGTRMRDGLTRDEVVYLAKVMEMKFAISDPPIGGAKAGIDFDPEDPRKEEVLRRWFGAIRPFLRGLYGTAGDLNVDGTREVTPLCRELGLGHPQEGIVRGHLGLDGEALERRLELMEAGLHQPAGEELGPGHGDGLAVYDLVTGYGVAAATLRLLEHQGREPGEARTLLEGFGAVGGSAGLYLARAGVPLVGVVDVDGGLVEPEGLGAEEVASLLRRRRGNRLPPDLPAGRLAADRDRFFETEADVFVCAAASGTVDRAALERLSGQGVEILACGANRPFVAEAPGDTELEQEADGRFSVLPDVVANCGAARAFFEQMRSGRLLEPAELFGAVERRITETVDALVERAGGPRRGLLAAALELTLDRLGPATARETGSRDRPDPVGAETGA